MYKLSKDELRRIMRQKRREIEEKQIKDNLIFRNLLSTPEFVNAKTVLCYASLDDEIKTDSIINFALTYGKCVALPKCRDKCGNMDFYKIKSLSEANKGYFGIREPNETNGIINDFDSSVIIVPALCCNKKGFRLGYGGGYYDRFLQKFNGISICLCYNSLIENTIPYDDNDMAVDIIVTDSEIIYTENGGKNG